MKWIYLIKADFEGSVGYKIGITSREPNKRMKELQTGNPAKLELVNQYQSKYANILEKTLHRTFLLDRELGEWFSLTQETVNGFQELCTKIENTFDLLAEENNHFQKNYLG